MKIVMIIPGSGGGFYCQNCVRDLTLVRALRRAGHDVVLVPLYLPLFGNGEGLPRRSPVFFGAVSLYVGERWPRLRWLARLMRFLLDSSPVLRLAARRAGSTRAAGLEDMTLSLLHGEHGRQSQELTNLVAWLGHEGPPDIIHLSNALLSGLAHRLWNELEVPIVCSLQDEDVWLDAMAPAAAKEAWKAIDDNCAAITAFTPVSNYYADLMRSRLGLLSARLEVVPLGIDIPPVPLPRPGPPPTPVIGYLSRLSEGLGFGLLVEAFLKLKAEPRFRELKLLATGGHTADDAAFLARLKKRLSAAGCAADVEFLPAFEGADRQRFLERLSVLSVPVPGGEAFGLYLLEAMAAGVPVVQPKTGAFPEIVAATGGGVIYEPNDPEHLAAALAGLLADRDQLLRLGQRGRNQVQAHFTADHMAAAMLRVYQSVIPR